jgi:hypothetical protein
VPQLFHVHRHGAPPEPATPAARIRGSAAAGGRPELALAAAAASWRMLWFDSRGPADTTNNGAGRGRGVPTFRGRRSPLLIGRRVAPPATGS